MFFAKFILILSSWCRPSVGHTLHFIFLSQDVFYFWRKGCTIRCSVKSFGLSIIKRILIVHFSFSKKVKLYVTCYRGCQMIIFLYKNMIFIFLTSSFYHLLWSRKEKHNISQDTAWNALQSTTESLFQLSTNLDVK